MRAIVVGAVGIALAAAASCKGAAKPGAAPSCASAAGKIARGMVEVRKDIATAGIDPVPEIAQLCDDDAWDAEVVRCYVGADAPGALRTCSDRLTSEQRLHARQVQEDLYRRASEVGDGTTGGATGIAACDEYLAVFALLNDCSAISQQIKDALGGSIDVMRPSWELVGDDDASREAVEIGCNAAADALRQTLVMQGC